MKGFLAHILILWVFLIHVQPAIIQVNNDIQQLPLITENSSKCQKTTYTSMFTMCEINFDFCNSTTFTFLNCYKKQCERYIRASQCRLWTRLQLDQSQCYKQCCGSTIFQESTCNNYNNKKQQSQSTITGAIIAIIVVSSLVLVAIVAYLLIKVQKCCQKTQFQKISKYNIFWRNQKVLDSICQICNMYGAFIQTPCGHHFHASCFQQNAKQNDLPLCPKCEQKMKQRLKISCSGCKEKIFKIKLWRLSHLQQIMKQARALHDQVCTQHSKSDQHLLSPYQK